MGEKYPLCICSIEGCGKITKAKGLCLQHYYAFRKNRSAVDASQKCSIEDCARGHWAKGYCRKHYDSLGRMPRKVKSSFHSPGVVIKAVKRWKENNPDKVAVYNKVKSHPDKIIVLSECPHTSTRKERHHPDYKRPYEVIRLCPKCHKQIHQIKTEVQS